MTTSVDLHLTDEAAQRLAEGLLDEASADAEVARHAACCPECCALVESHRALAEALDGLDLPEVPEGFTAGVLCCIEAADLARARERRVAAAVLGGVLVAALGALAASGAGGLGAAVGHWADLLGDATRALRVGREVVPSVFAAMRWPLAAASAALAVPLLLILARLVPQPATRTI